MKVCSECRRCFADSTVSCTEKVHPALSVTREGDVEIIKGYRLELLIKSDLAGELYRARQTASNHSCLIRILASDDQRTTDRFLHEGRIASSMFHPNVVDTYEVGTLSSGELYVVSEDAEGQSLRDLLLNVGVPQLLTSIQVTRQAAEAIHALHVSELTHRAINPENIILANDSEYRLLVRVRHIDFGGAMERAIVSDKFLIDEAIESLKYFAPEQCSTEVTTAAADVYGLGIVFYEMLSGAPPFDATSAAGLIEKHRNRRPPDVRIDNFHLRMLVTHTLTESLQKRPDVRHVSANAFARQLRHIEQLATHSPTPPPAGMTAPGTQRPAQVTVVAANPAQPVPPRPVTVPKAAPELPPQQSAQVVKTKEVKSNTATAEPVKETSAAPVVVKEKAMVAKVEGKPEIVRQPSNVAAMPGVAPPPAKVEAKREIVRQPSNVEAKPVIIPPTSKVDAKPETVVSQNPVTAKIEAKPEILVPQRPVEAKIEAKIEAKPEIVNPSKVPAKPAVGPTQKRVAAKVEAKLEIAPDPATVDRKQVKESKPVESKIEPGIAEPEPIKLEPEPVSTPERERVDVREIARELVVARSASEPEPSVAVEPIEAVEPVMVLADDLAADTHEEQPALAPRRSRLKLWKKKLHAMSASLAASAPEASTASTPTIDASVTSELVEPTDVVVAQTVLESARAEQCDVEPPTVEKVSAAAPQLAPTPAKIKWHQPDDVPLTEDVVEAVSPLTKLPTKIELAESEDDIPSSQPVVRAASPLAKAPRKIEWSQPDDDIPSTDDVVEAASPLAKAPTKIAWNQPEDDIPPIEDVLEATSPLATTPQKIEWDQPEDIPSMRDVLEAAASNGNATKIEWDQPEEDIPSMDAVREVRASEGLNPEPIMQPEPAPEPPRLVDQDLLVAETINLELAKKVAAMQKKLAAPAVTDPPKKAMPIAKVAKKKPAQVVRKAEPPKVVPEPVAARPPVKQSVPQRQTAPIVDGEEITLVRPPRRIKIDLERPESRQVRISTNRSISHAPAGVSYIPTILGSKPEINPNDRAASDPMFAAYYNEPSRRFTIPYRSLAVGGGFMALLALYLVGDGFIGEHVQSKNPNRAAVSDKAPVTRVDKQKVVAPAPKPIEKPAEVVEEAEYKPLADNDRLTRSTDKPVKSTDAKADSNDGADHGRTSKTASVAKSATKPTTPAVSKPAPVVAKVKSAPKSTPKKETASITVPSISTHPANSIRPRIVKVPKS